MSQPNDTGYIIEYYAIGNAVKVTAIDPETGIEATTIAPSYMGRPQMAQAAIHKLKYRIRKLSEQAGTDAN